ncbi:MAG: pseudouridine-5'-phosphate glycosidase [Alphaproteobacteria bacterium]
MHDALDLNDEVAAALADGRPVVALESTLIAHGLPHPRNLQTASQVASLVRAGGAVPATVGIIGGRIKVGLDRDEIERLVAGAAKVSRADMAPVLARRGLGATTVAATMVCAALAGIRVLVTGGIGGVHRGGEASLDVSADLGELARRQVAVVCAGAKSILDLGRTLEVLETEGVPVIGYRTDTFPSFHVRDSGLELAARVDTPGEAASVMEAQWRLGLGGLVFAAPVPEEAALDAAEVERLVAHAEADAAMHGVAGRALTPYLLGRLAELSGDRTVAANISLIENNASIGAAIAAAYVAGN